MSIQRPAFAFVFAEKLMHCVVIKWNALNIINDNDINDGLIFFYK